MKHYNIRVTGRVQGVGFRYSAMRMAQSYAVTGFVRNEADGSVYIEAEGEEPNLGLFLDWCETGPGFGRVEKVYKNESNMQNYTDFSVR